METEIIDKLFLELSQVTGATTKRELQLRARVAELEKANSALVAVAEAAGKYREACEDFEHMCERAVEEGWGDDPTGSTHVSSAADREQRSLAALDAALEAMNT